MKPSKISAFFYPTTVVFVDDNKSFLKKIRLSLTNLPCHFYSEPKGALEFLKKYKPNSFVQRFLPDESELDRLVVDVSFRDIHQQIYNPRRSAEIAVVVVDYAMPGINGLKFCEQQKGSPIKKLMLTGETDQKFAIEAFNTGVIDKFIMKNSPNYEETVIQAIYDLQTEYFHRLSESIIKSAQSLNQLRCLDDPSFIKLFASLCEKHQIVEYYLLDDKGSFLFLDAQGKPSWLIVTSAHDMDGLHQFAEMADGGVPASVLKALKNHTGLVYFHTDADLQVSPAEWEAYLHSAQPVDNKNKYYYAYIENPNAFDIETQRIFSYAQFLKKS